MAIPVGVALGRRVLIPIFADLGVAIPKFTQLLLWPYAPTRGPTLLLRSLLPPLLSYWQY